MAILSIILNKIISTVDCYLIISPVQTMTMMDLEKVPHKSTIKNSFPFDLVFQSLC